MPTPIRPIALLALTLVMMVMMVMAGCRSTPKAPEVTVGEVTYELPSGADVFRVTEHGVYFQNPDVDFRVDDRRFMMVNSVPYGRLDRGDRVRLTQDGTVYVNGTERRAEADRR